MIDRQSYYPSNSNYGINLLFSGQETCSAGHTFGPAKRTNYILHYICEGLGFYKVGNKSYSLSKGQYFVVYPGDITLYRADPDNPWTYLWVGFDGTDCDPILAHIGITKDHYSSASHKPDLTLDVFNKIVQSSPLDLANPVKRTAILMDLLASLSSTEVHLKQQEASSIRQALDFIHNNYQYDVKISHLASTVNLERSWLYRLFQEEMGTSPKAYLTDYRLKIAKEHLHTSNLTLTEVALTCGFINSSSFHKHFKKAFGITPKTYRDLNHER